MIFFDWFKRTPSPQELMKKREDAELIEQLHRMALIVEDGCVSNRGLSEYGAQKLIEGGREPGLLEKLVLISDGTFVTFNEWKMRNFK